MRELRSKVTRALRQAGPVHGDVFDRPLHKWEFGPLHHGTNQGPLSEGIPKLSGTYQNYDYMDRSPFLAMAKEWKLGPVRNAVGSWKAKDDSVPKERIDFVQNAIEPLIPGLIGSLADSLSMGNSPNRIMWDIETKPIPGISTVHWVPKEIIPLDHHKTFVRIQEGDIERFRGLETAGYRKNIELEPEEVIYYRYDPRPRRAYWWYGRSLHENIREEFAEYKEDVQLMHRLSRKLSGVVAIAKIIKGLARDSKGHVIDRFQAAKDIVDYLATSMGAVFEVIGVSDDEIKRDPKLAQISDIDVNALDLGSSSPAYGMMLTKRQNLQREMVMGWLVPPPAIMDVQTGGKADTEEKSDKAMIQSEVLGMLFHKHAIIPQLVDRMLLLNFGPEAVGTIWREATRHTEEERRASERVMAAIVNNPVILAAALKVIDVGTVFRNTNTPTLESSDDIELDIPDMAPKPAAGTPPTKPQAVKGSTRTTQGKNRGVNGNGRL